MKVRDKVQEKVFDRVEDHREVLNTGWTIREIEADLDRREETLDKIETKVDSYSKEKKHFLHKALDAGARKKVRFYAKAKEADMKRSFWSDLWENLMVQQFFLIKLLLEAKRHELLTQPTDIAGDLLGNHLDIQSLNVEAVKTALESNEVEQTEIHETIEELDLHLHDSGDGELSLDLSEVKREAAELEVADIGSGESGLGTGMEAAMDEQIREALDEVDQELDEDR